MTHHAIEIVTFKLTEGTNEATFLKASEIVTKFAKSCDGFVKRQLSKADDGSWMDYVEWATLEDAKAAAAKFGQQSELGPFMAYLDGSSINLKHNALMLNAS